MKGFLSFKSELCGERGLEMAFGYGSDFYGILIGLKSQMEIEIIKNCLINFLI